MPRLTVSPASLARARFGPDADGHHHEVGGKLGAVVEAHGTHAWMRPFGRQERLRIRLAAHLDTPAFQLLLEEIPGRGIELALHQRRHQVDNGDRHALQGQTRGCLEAEQAAPDDDGTALDFAASSMASTSSRSR